jgi:excisionase family DNA binding protein
MIEKITPQIEPGQMNRYDSDLFDNLINEDRLLTKKDLSHYLNVSIKMIDRKVQMNEIPFIKIGRLVRFSKIEVMRWAKATNLKKDRL